MPALALLLLLSASTAQAAPPSRRDAEGRYVGRPDLSAAEFSKLRIFWQRRLAELESGRSAAELMLSGTVPLRAERGGKVGVYDRGGFIRFNVGILETMLERLEDAGLEGDAGLDALAAYTLHVVAHEFEHARLAADLKRDTGLVYAILDRDDELFGTIRELRVMEELSRKYSGPLTGMHGEFDERNMKLLEIWRKGAIPGVERVIALSYPGARRCVRTAPREVLLRWWEENTAKPFEDESERAVSQTITELFADEARADKLKAFYRARYEAFIKARGLTP